MLLYYFKRFVRHNRTTLIMGLLLLTGLLVTSCQKSWQALEPNQFSLSAIARLAEEIPGANANSLVFLANDSVFRLDITRTLQAIFGEPAIKLMSLNQVSDFYQLELNREDQGQGYDSLMILQYATPSQVEAILPSLKQLLSSPNIQISQLGNVLLLQIQKNADPSTRLSGQFADNSFSNENSFYYTPQTLFSAISTKPSKDLTTAFWSYLEKIHPDFKTPEFNQFAADFQQMADLSAANSLEKMTIVRLSEQKIRFDLTVLLRDDDQEQYGKLISALQLAKTALEDLQDSGKAKDVKVEQSAAVLKISFTISEYLLVN